MTEATSRCGSAALLARLARARDAEAWMELLELHAPQIQRVARRILGDAALAEDACQETLLHVRDRAGLFVAPAESADAAARNWIMRVACNVALQMLRKRHADRQREDRAESFGREPLRGPEAHAEDEERLEAVHREMSALAEYERVPLVLHFYGGLNYKDLAEALGCPVNTAKTRVHRSVEKLRNRLALLGLVLAAGQMTELLGCTAHAAEPCAAGKLETWRQLLHSNREPVLPAEAGLVKKGWSAMAKVSMLVAALLCSMGALWLAVPVRGADERAGAKNRGPHEETRGEEPKEEDAAVSPVTDPKVPATAEEKKAVGAGINALGLDLYARLKASNGNLFISPYSVSTALSMTWGGARGETAMEITKALRLPLGQDRMHLAAGALLADLNAGEAGGIPRSFQLASANRLFAAQQLNMLPAFLELTSRCYNAPAEKLDFAGAVEASRKHINAWVEGQTQEKINDLIQAGQLQPVTQLVLVNAVYFKADWLMPFTKEATHDRAFFPAVDKQVQAPMMRRTASYRYYEEEGKYQAVELDYKGNEVTMLILLPAQKDGLAGLEDVLTSAKLTACIEGLKPVDVALTLPKFKFSWGTKDIVGSLKQLGMVLAFDPYKADFSGIVKRPDGPPMPGAPLCISLVLHKAFVEVDEKGTEAAAATAVVMVPGAAPVRERPKPRVFTADHPFFFAIRHKATNAILFAGRVSDPTLHE